MQTHLEPQQDHGKGQHGGVTTHSLLITGRHPAILLQAVDEPFDLIALPIKRPVKGPGRMLVLFSWNGRSDASPMQVTTIFSESIAFITRQPLRSDAQLTTATPDRSLFHQLLSHGDLVLLPWS
jgi:hypothetical protein